MKFWESKTGKVVSSIIGFTIILLIVVMFTLPQSESPEVVQDRLDSLFQFQSPKIKKILKYESSIAIDDFCDKYTIQYNKDDFDIFLGKLDLSKWQGNNNWNQKMFYLNSMYNQVLVTIAKASSVIEVDFCHE